MYIFTLNLYRPKRKNTYSYRKVGYFLSSRIKIKIKITTFSGWGYLTYNHPKIPNAKYSHFKPHNFNFTTEKTYPGKRSSKQDAGRFINSFLTVKAKAASWSQTRHMRWPYFVSVMYRNMNKFSLAVEVNH